MEQTNKESSDNPEHSPSHLNPSNQIANSNTTQVSDTAIFMSSTAALYNPSMFQFDLNSSDDMWSQIANPTDFLNNGNATSIDGTSLNLFGSDIALDLNLSHEYTDMSSLANSNPGFHAPAINTTLFPVDLMTPIPSTQNTHFNQPASISNPTETAISNTHPSVPPTNVTPIQPRSVQPEGRPAVQKSIKSDLDMRIEALHSVLQNEIQSPTHSQGKASPCLSTRSLSSSVSISNTPPRSRTRENTADNSVSESIRAKKQKQKKDDETKLRIVCDGCGDSFGVCLLGSSTENLVPPDSRVVTRSCSNRGRKCRYFATEEKEKSLDDADLICSIGNHKIGRGGVITASKPIFKISSDCTLSPVSTNDATISAVGDAFGKLKAEINCDFCLENYSLCKSCGTGNRFKSGKWRPKTIFSNGRKTCMLSHKRVGNAKIQYNVQKLPASSAATLSDCKAIYEHSILSYLLQAPTIELSDQKLTFISTRRIIENSWSNILDYFQSNEIILSNTYVATAEKVNTDTTLTTSVKHNHNSIRVPEYLVGFLIAEYIPEDGTLVIWKCADISNDANSDTSLLIQMIGQVVHHFQSSDVSVINVYIASLVENDRSEDINVDTLLTFDHIAIGNALKKMGFCTVKYGQDVTGDLKRWTEKIALQKLRLALWTNGEDLRRKFAEKAMKSSWMNK